MKKFFLFIFVIIAITALIVFFRSNQVEIGNTILKNGSTPPSVISDDQNAPAVSTIANDLDVPWSISFLPDQSMLVTERTGNLLKISDGRKTIIGTLPIKKIGEGGLLGLAVDPDFPSNKFIYLYYTFSSDGNNTLNRVVRFKLDNDKLSDEKVLIGKIPGATFHNGGRLKFGPDGFLYITTGDAGEPSQAQDRSTLAGKILRIKTDGQAAPGNPFNDLVYSYGHRNPQGITWDTSDKMWQTEHGRSQPTGFDEINIIETGKNYGWPTIQGDESRNGMVTPILNSGPSGVWAPGSAAFLNGSIFFGGLKGQALYEYKISSRELIEHLKDQHGRIRDVVVGPDNMLYITTSNKDGRGNPVDEDDKILKINPQKLGL